MGMKKPQSCFEKLVIGKPVRIEETIPDQYGRGMALVYVGNTLINKEMLSSGWVRFHHDNASVTDELKDVVAKAKRTEEEYIPPVTRQTRQTKKIA